MNVNDDKLLIQSVPYDLETGEKLEPEAVPTSRVIVGTATAMGKESGEFLGMIPTSMERQSDAIEFANARRSLCGNCKHFDQAGYLKWITETTEGQLFEAEQRSKFAQDFVMNPHRPELVHAMKFLGFCRIITEINHELSVTRPDYSCLGATVDQPLGYWDPVTSEDEKIASANYDHILRVAQGNK